MVAGKRKAVFQLTPFVIAWTLAAVYGAVLLAVAVMIGIKLMRSRAAARGQDGLTVASDACGAEAISIAVDDRHVVLRPGDRTTVPVARRS